MARVVAIDFGLKRTGVAISDPTNTIANGLEAVDSRQLMEQLSALQKEKPYDTLVVGHPRHRDGSDADIERNIQWFLEDFGKIQPSVHIERLDERFTSKLALQTMIDAGSTKKQRREKGMIDKISATLILQEFLSQTKR